MGLLAEAFNPRPRAEAWNESASPLSDFWYRDPNTGFMLEGSSGVAMSAETILNCSTVYAAVAFKAAAWAMCPPSTYRKTSTGRQEQPAHYSQIVLRDPNLRDTGYEWRELNGFWMSTWGNAYNEIIPGAGSFADELRPLDPMWTGVADKRADGSLIYAINEPGMEERRLGQERVLHFKGPSMKGDSGLPMYQLIRNVVAIALLAEQHAMTFLRKGARAAGLLVPSTPLEKAERDELRDSANKSLGGASNTGTFGILPFGVDIKPISNTMRESQFVELSDQVVGAILRFLGVPGVVVGYADKTATYASAKEFFESGGLKHCVLPMLRKVEEREEKSLLPRGGQMFIRHNLDILLRANTKDRFEALYRAVGGPWMTVNEARRIEDMNEDPDERHDEILTPVNMSPDPQPEPEPQPPPRGTPPPNGQPDGMDDDEEEDDPQAALLRQYAHDNAMRVVNREVKAILAKAPKNARNKDAWRAAVLELYGEHVEHVAKIMRVPRESAQAYCDRQAAALLARGASAVETWEAEVPPRLVALALGEAPGAGQGAGQ